MEVVNSVVRQGDSEIRAAIYARLSVNRTGDSVAVERQEADCRELAQRNGWTVSHVFVDNGKSAWHESAKRPGYEALLDGIKRHEFNYVVVYEVDRLGRRLRTLLDLMDLLIEHKVVVHTVKSGLMRLDSPMEIANAQMKAVFAEQYVNDARDKNLRKRRELAEQGVRHFTARPYGWEDDGVTVRESEAKIVREMVDRLIRGQAGARIARDLNSRGIPSRSGGIWHGRTIQVTALRASNAGLRSHHGVEYQGNWEPIIDLATYRRLQSVIAHRPAVGYRKAGRKHLLTGFAVCGVCGAQLSAGAGRSNGKPAYRCDRRKSHRPDVLGCGKISRSAVPLEHLIKEAVLYRLASRPLLELLNRKTDDSALKALIDEATEQRQRLSELVDDYATGLLDRGQFAKAKHVAETRYEALQREIASKTASTTITMDKLATDARAWWERASLDEQRDLLDLLIKRVVLLPWPKSGFKLSLYEVDGIKYRFNPDYVSIDWLV